MEWITQQDRNGYSLERPADWVVQSLPGPTWIVKSPAGLHFAVIQYLNGVGNVSGVEIIRDKMFPAAFLFPDARVEKAEPGPDGSAHGVFSYRAAIDEPGSALLVFSPLAEGRGRLHIMAAPETHGPLVAPILLRITQSVRQTAIAAAPAAPVTYTRYTEPQMGSFTIDMPVGWQAGGGFVHPSPGDRRGWFETSSPDGIYILCDPGYPQNFCHFRGWAEGNYVRMVTNGLFLNLTPSAERLSDDYLRRNGARRLGPFQIVSRRPRTDAVNLVATKLRQLGISISKSFQITATETVLQLTGGKMPRSASLLTTAVFNGQYGMGTWGFWDANVYLYLAPPSLAARAEDVRMHMLASHRFEPAMMQIYQRDESIISSSAQAANAAQWGWFAGQQQAHFAQVAAGDAIVNNYWRQQAANDSMLRGWEHNQAINDRLSQERSDAMLGNQRLADATDGKEYTVPAGANYFWRNQQTGQITGTTTDTPPDYSNNYTPLQKL